MIDERSMKMLDDVIEGVVVLGKAARNEIEAIVTSAEVFTTCFKLQIFTHMSASDGSSRSRSCQLSEEIDRWQETPNYQEG